ncbi:MAG: hypothetical protein KAV00_15080 [Phycisphaerae bacterium]|nr:hypothetical protein [Phycisphaerae bacterium]
MIVLSLGWGVQSWALAAMSALGEIPLFDAAVHSDTGFERADTYAFAARWTPWLQEHGIPVHTVRPAFTGIDGLFFGRQPFPLLPMFTLGLDGKGSGMLRRRCTAALKLTPVRRWLFPQRGRVPIDLCIGISSDEKKRAKPSKVRYIRKCYPLVASHTRQDLIAWIRRARLEVPPKSTCVCCPFHSKEAWLHIRENATDWAMALRVDEEIRARMNHRFLCYLHRQRVALDQCDLS